MVPCVGGNYQAYVVNPCVVRFFFPLEVISHEDKQNIFFVSSMQISRTKKKIDSEGML